MKLEKLEKLLYLVLLFSCVAIGFSIGMLYNSYPMKEWININDKDTECVNGDFLMKAECLNKEFKTWWKYNLSNSKLYYQDKEINWSRIMAEGGVCWHASQWYIEQAKKIDLYGDRISFWDNGNVQDFAKIGDNGHSMALLWNKNMTNYCILDQETLVGCGGLG